MCLAVSRTLWRQRWAQGHTAGFPLWRVQLTKTNAVCDLSLLLLDFFQTLGMFLFIIGGEGSNAVHWRKFADAKITQRLMNVCARMCVNIFWRHKPWNRDSLNVCAFPLSFFFGGKWPYLTCAGLLINKHEATTLSLLQSLEFFLFQG